MCPGSLQLYNRGLIHMVNPLFVNKMCCFSNAEAEKSLTLTRQKK